MMRPEAGARVKPMPPPAELVETHISVIAMIGDRAYKLMKPVRMAFLDHRRREDRLDACRRETEVNRRFAPDVYLGVLDVVDDHGHARDHLIEMRRMPASRRLSALLDDADAPDLVREVARTIAGFHREAPTSPRIAEAGRIAVVLGLWEEGLDQLAGVSPEVVPREEVERARTLARAYLGGRRALLERRIAEGWVRDGHGDLLADDVFCLADGPRVLDCLAFDDRLRHGDVLGDVAFLAMDLEANGHPELGEVLIEEWRRELGESHPASLAHHYLAYRAHVRSKVAALRAGQGGDADAAARARRLHGLVLRHLERAQVRMVLVGGAPGTGKSTLARALGDATGWAVLRSDEIRKDLAGLSRTPADPGPFGAGLYAPEVSGRVYAEMLDRAAGHLALGESVVLDASWSAAGRRAAARRVASECDAEAIEIRCRLASAIANARIQSRRAAGEGSSDATPEIAERLAASADPWPEVRSIGTQAPPGLVLREARRLVGPV
jgi:aminoglycoside phosphotransferase family enzyme/predicted kinase